MITVAIISNYLNILPIMRKIAVLISITLIIFSFQFCTKNDSASIVDVVNSPNLPANTLNYLIDYPTHIKNALNTNDNTPLNNVITSNGATLGRVLFYDTQLSKNNTISCGSCHKPNNSFDDDIALSKGFNGGSTSRKSMPLLNVRFYRSGKMFWDERALSLEKQVLQPIQNHVEMGLTLAELESKVKALDYYPSLFNKAFGSTDIDSVKISKALSQFVRSIVTYQSKYDRVKQGLESFTNAETQGEQLFLNAGNISCAGCHTPPMFLTSNPVAGFGLVDANDIGINGGTRFKSGSLRNISVRTNLFHNGSVSNVLTMLQAGAPGTGTQPIPQHSVAPQDVQNMIAFLNTLTDITLVNEERFSDPFKK
jgi:cytochrome c peroxidase